MRNNFFHLAQPEFLAKNEKQAEFWKFYPLNDNINFYINQFIEKKDEDLVHGTMLENSLNLFIKDFNNKKPSNLVESSFLLEKWFDVFRNFDG